MSTPNKCPGNDSYANGWNKCLTAHQKTFERVNRYQGLLLACLPYLTDNPDLHQPGAEMLGDAIRQELGI